jgi:hypothetical protein
VKQSRGTYTPIGIPDLALAIYPNQLCYNNFSYVYGVHIQRHLINWKHYLSSDIMYKGNSVLKSQVTDGKY